MFGGGVVGCLWIAFVGVFVGGTAVVNRIVLVAVVGRVVVEKGKLKGDVVVVVVVLVGDWVAVDVVIGVSFGRDGIFVVVILLEEIETLLRRMVKQTGARPLEMMLLLLSLSPYQ